MTVTSQAGRRSVLVEVLVPGTVDQVWQAIATGPGMSAWFVPTTFEQADGKPVAVTFTFGPGMAPRSPVTLWEPPRQFAAEGQGWNGSPPITSTFRVIDQGDGRCLVQAENSIAADSDAWDGLLQMTGDSWPGFFRTLAVYLTHFAGQPAALLQLVSPAAGSEADAWRALTAAMNLQGAAVGRPWQAPAGLPLSAGVVEYYSEEPYDALLRLAQPAPGIVALGVFSPGEQAMVAMNVYRYGPDAEAAVARERPLLEAWMAQHLAAR